MNFKKSLCSLIALCAFPLPLSAGVDFEWRLSLNNRWSKKGSELNSFNSPKTLFILIMRFALHDFDRLCKDAINDAIFFINPTAPILR